MLTINGKQVFSTLTELVKPEYTALVIIDMQNDFMTRGGCSDTLGWTSPGQQEIVPRIKKILDAARRNGVMVCHVQMTGYPGFLTESPATLRSFLLRASAVDSDWIDKFRRRLIEGSWGWQIIEALAPLPGEIIIRKHRSSAFVGTDLDLILRSNGIKTTVIVGVVTNGCVMATANDAPFLGYYPVLVRDCVSSHKPELHQAAIQIMSQTKDTVDSPQILELWP